MLWAFMFGVLLAILAIFSYNYLSDLNHYVWKIIVVWKHHRYCNKQKGALKD